MLGWRLPRRDGSACADTQPEPWLSSEVSTESSSETSTWRPRAGALALDQRRLDPGHREQPADEVDDRRADLHRRALGLAGDAHQPAHRLQQQVVAGQPGRALG